MTATHRSLLKSWNRSERYGVNNERALAAVLDEQSFQKHKENSAQFIKNVSPAVEQIASLFKKYESVAVLTDHNGVLLESKGTPAFISKRNEVYFKPASNWSERTRGTNSAGTVCVEGRPLAIVGDEHYLKVHRQLYCVGAPIFNPFSCLQGVINVTGHASMYHPSMLEKVDQFARNIEKRMLLQNKKEQIVFSFKREFAQKDQVALLSVNNHGDLLGMNRIAREMFLHHPLAPLPQHVTEIFKNAEQLFAQTNKNSYTFQLINKEQSDELKVQSNLILNTYPKTMYFPKIINKQRDQTLKQNDAFASLFGNDSSFKKALQLASKVAPTNYTVALYGESGTGKELVAQAIHASSMRKGQPFVALNCGELTKNLAESRLFGYEKGAFREAKCSGHPGVFEQANGGTLFLDEIAELPLDIQATLLRVLEDFHILRMGGSTYKTVDIRLITATDTNLWAKVEKGLFRKDLFFRLQGIQIELPPLRRRGDRLQYARKFLEQYKCELDLPDVQFSNESVVLINNYEWPGNIRQLKSAIKEAVFKTDTNLIEIRDFPNYIVQSYNKRNSSEGNLLQKVEEQTIQKIYKETKGNISEAARILGIGRTTLYRKLKQMENN